jgi:glutamate 5-kinase
MAHVAKKRWVIKLGTGILTRPDGRLDLRQIGRLVDQVARLKRAGYDVILVSSGAVGGGMGILELKKRPAAIQELQACAAIGQPHLMGLYEGLFRKKGLHVAQILLTYLDLDSRALYQNTQKTLDHLLRLKKFVPIINENDVVSYEEIKFGDNDQLSAHVAVMAKASRLIILSNIPGLTTKSDGTGELVPVVKKIDAGIEALAGKTRSQTSVGGMVSKLLAGKIANAAGITLQIANGRAPDTLIKICKGQRVGTTFLP